MTNELATQEQGTDLSTERAAPSGSSMLAQVAAAASNPEIDAEKMKVLAELGMQLEDREAERRYREAKAQAMAAMPSIGKKGEILNKNQRVQSRFSHFEELHRQIVPILQAFDLSLDWVIGDHQLIQGQGIIIPVAARLTYSDGEMKFTETGGALPFPIDNMGGKTPVQGVASSLSMGKRHTMKAMLNIREHDGNEGEGGVAPGPDLTEAEQVLISDAMAAASDGQRAYAEHWKALPRADKQFLVSKGTEAGTYHDQNKKAAEQADK